MEIPFLDLGIQFEALKNEITAEVFAVLNSGTYILGPKVIEFETAIAEYCNSSFAIGVSSGTDALLASLMACQVQSDDLVITSPFTFFATAGSIARLNAKPVFLDIEPEYYTLCPIALHNYLSDKATVLSKIKAIIPVHLYGQMSNMTEIVSIAKQFNIPVIEDAAQSLGASCTYSKRSRSAGSIGIAGCFSFYPTKNLGGMGDGGMIVTSDSALAETLYMLRNHGSKVRNIHSLIGGNFRLDSIQAAILNIKRMHLDTWNSERRTIAAFYDTELKNVPLKTPAIREAREHHIYNQYVVHAGSERDNLQQFLISKGIRTEIYYPKPLHLQESFAYLKYGEGSLPVSESAARSTLALPIYPGLTLEKLEYIVARIKEYYS